MHIRVLASPTNRDATRKVALGGRDPKPRNGARAASRDAGGGREYGGSSRRRARRAAPCGEKRRGPMSRTAMVFLVLAAVGGCFSPNRDPVTDIENLRTVPASQAR